MRALWHITKEESEIKEINTEIRHDTLVQSQYSLISVGTEKLVSLGKVPENMFETMKVPFMEGSLGLPVKYGYSLIGRVVESSVFEKGELVHVMHPHQNLITVPATSLVKVPNDIPEKRAILVANMETVINAIWDGDVQLKAKILIAGYGIIGALLARICKTKYDAEIFILENNIERNKLREQHGYNNAINYSGLYSIAFNCTANEQALQYCIDNIEEESTVVELSWYGTNKVSISLGDTFHSMRKKIISSQVSKIPKQKVQSWNFKDRKELAFDYLKDSFFDQLLTNEIEFDESAIFFNKLRLEQPNGIGFYIKY